MLSQEYGWRFNMNWFQLKIQSITNMVIKNSHPTDNKPNSHILHMDCDLDITKRSICEHKLIEIPDSHLKHNFTCIYTKVTLTSPTIHGNNICHHEAKKNIYESITITHPKATPILLS